MLLDLWKKEKEPMNGALGFSVKGQRSSQEAHAVCDARAHSLIGKPKFVGYEAMMNLLDVMPCECEAHT